MEVGLTPLETDEGLFVLGAIVDITERKTALEQLQRHQSELAHVSRLNTMGEMAVGLAHELKQPLSAMSNYANACLNHLDGDRAEPVRTRDLLGRIVGEAQRAAEIIRRLRRFSQKVEQPNTLVNVNELARDVVGLTAFEARHRGVSLRLDLSTSVPLVLGDAIQLEQVLVNLVRNSFDAMERLPATERVMQIRTPSRAGRRRSDRSLRDRFGKGRASRLLGPVVHGLLHHQVGGPGDGAIDQSLDRRGAWWATVG